jgi:hypothetical protein
LRLDSGTPSGSSSIQSPVKQMHSSSPHAVVQPTPSKDWALDEELCRQQLEALRQEVGHSWISVLGDHPWDNAQKGFAAHHLAGAGLDHPVIPTAPLVRANSHAILSGGHALGG